MIAQIEVETPTRPGTDETGQVITTDTFRGRPRLEPVDTARLRESTHV
jgi:hypothetical protein